eukprot:966601-Rhodomonas_salina.1
MHTNTHSNRHTHANAKTDRQTDKPAATAEQQRSAGRAGRERKEGGRGRTSVGVSKRTTFFRALPLPLRRLSSFDRSQKHVDTSACPAPSSAQPEQTQGNAETVREREPRGT